MPELNVSNRNLQHLEAIDPTITIINCSGNLLEELPPLPEILLELICSTNNLQDLPDLPPTLQLLNCSDNPIKELPPLPISLQRLLCGFTSIQSLTLPTLLNLTSIDCFGCKLEEIPVLPLNVTELNCANNSIVRLLSPLPHGLTSLICSDNELVGLPELPNSVLQLECDHNNILLLPTLPDNMQTLICSSNRLRELPSLPSSILRFDVNYNPLNIEASNIVRAAFPDQEFIPAGNPEDFLETDEPEPLEDYEEDHDLTEGDHIEERNIAIQQEVHEAFDKIDLTKLYAVIQSESTLLYDPARIFAIIEELVNHNTLDDRESTIYNFQQITANIRDTLQSCIRDDETQRLVATVLDYVGRQNPEFKNNYIRFLIEDISSAYEFNPEIPDLQTASCAKGIKERIIMSLKSATIGQTETYQPLLHAFVHKIPIDIMRQFTSDCMRDARVKDMLEATPNMDEKVKILADCIREKLRPEYFPTSQGAEEIPDPPEFTEYVATLRYGLEGGKKKKTKNNKLKKMKTKRKINKNKKKTKRKENKNKKKTKKFNL
uniref:Uncharacterized protein n=1 Tax=viral metagenome TaxID=1070528 RepID=A0A6C0B9M9_9ZZZZ